MTKRKQGLWIALFLLPTLCLFAVIYAVPLGTVISTSLFDYRLMPHRFRFVGGMNFVDLFRDPIFKLSLFHTALWIFIHCTVHIGLGTFIAMRLYKKPRGWKFIRVAYMTPSIISNAAIATIFINIYNPQYGVLNSILRLCGMSAWQRNWLYDNRSCFLAVTLIWTLFAGYTVILVLSSALNVDQSLIDAAKVGGANPWQVDRYIMLPLVKPMIGTTTIMAATYMLQMFDIVYITTKGGPGQMTMNLSLLLYQTYAKENNYGSANAIGVVIIVLGFLTMLLINRIYRLNRREDGTLC